MELDSLTIARLEWMFENQPEFVKELLESGQIAKLEEVLNARVVDAIRYAHKMQAQGRPEREAIEIASEVMLTPADGPAFSDNPPKPLPQKLRQKVYRKLEEREAAEERDRAQGQNRR